MGRDAAISPPSASAKRFGQFDIFLLFDSATDGDNDFRLRKIDGLLGFFERIFRLVALDAVGDIGVHGFNRSGGCAGFSFVATECAGLEGNKVRRGAGKRNVGSELALEHLAGKDQLATVFAEADSVTDERALERRGQLRSEVAHLVSVRHQHQRGLFLVDEVFERRDHAIRLILGQLGRFNYGDLGQLFSGDLLGNSGDAAAKERGLNRCAGFSGNGLRSRNGLHGDAVQLAFTLFSNYKDCVCHLVYLPFLFDKSENYQTQGNDDIGREKTLHQSAAGLECPSRRTAASPQPQ